MLKYYDGTHDGPMHYVVRLAPPDHTEAWLHGRFNNGRPERQLLCRIEQPDAELAKCAEALWRDGAHHNSMLELWWGEFPGGGNTPDRVMTTTIAAAVPAAYAEGVVMNATDVPIFKYSEIGPDDDYVYVTREVSDGVTVYVVNSVRGSGSSGIDGEFTNREEAEACAIRLAREDGYNWVCYGDITASEAKPA